MEQFRGWRPAFSLNKQRRNFYSTLGAHTQGGVTGVCSLSGLPGFTEVRGESRASCGMMSILIVLLHTNQQMERT